MAEQPDTRALVARQGAILERARPIVDAGDPGGVTEGTRLINQLADAFAWLAGAPTPAWASGESLLSQAEERLRRLEERAAERIGEQSA